MTKTNKTKQVGMTNATPQRDLDFILVVSVSFIYFSINSSEIQHEMMRMHSNRTISELAKQ